MIAKPACKWPSYPIEDTGNCTGHCRYVARVPDLRCKDGTRVISSPWHYDLKRGKERRKAEAKDEQQAWLCAAVVNFANQ